MTEKSKTYGHLTIEVAIIPMTSGHKGVVRRVVKPDDPRWRPLVEMIFPEIAKESLDAITTDIYKNDNPGYRET